jgi:phosphoribosylglycinamide formyltransferase-1
MNRTLGVLISGRGSNLQAIIDAISIGRLDAEIRVVISNRADAAGLERARSRGIEAIVLDHRPYRDRADYDRELAQHLTTRAIDVVCLAGFMRILGPTFLREFSNPILNIHPSLLPAFPGTDAQLQALEHGVKVSGATVHLVTNELDQGPIVVQAAVQVKDDDTPQTLADRILAEEHRIYPEGIRIVLNGGWRVEGRRFIRASPTQVQA